MEPAPSAPHLQPAASTEPPAEQTNRPGVHRRMPRWAWAIIVPLGLLLLLGVLAALLAPQSRPWFLREANERLQGYTLALGGVAFRPWSLTLEFRDIVVRQQAHPDPPVLALPRLQIDVEWRALLRGRVVARALFDAPAIVVDLAQLRTEARDPVPLARRGWQRLPELYPLEINALVVRDGTLVYLAPGAQQPLRLAAVQGWVRNIRHVEAGGATHPSPLHLQATVFDTGHARFDGAGDFLRHARPALRGTGSIDAVPLATLGPVLRGYPLRIAGGTLAAAGDVDYGPRGTRAHLARVAIEGIRIDYLAGGDTRQRDALQRAADAARRASRDPAIWLRMDELVVDGQLGLVNRGREPAYRLFLDQARVLARGVDNRRSQRRATLEVTGRPMGSGRAAVRGEFRTGPGPADFALDVRVNGTSLPALNPMLRAHARLDAAAGVGALYSQVLVRDGRIRGYVKPLLRDVEIYDRDQDGDDSVLRQLYELVADGIRRILENDRRDTVGTVADLSGPVKDPQASVLQIIGNLARNAFIEAILPGFESEAGRRSRSTPDRRPGASRPGASRPDASRPSASRPAARPATRDARARTAWSDANRSPPPARVADPRPGPSP